MGFPRPRNKSVPSCLPTQRDKTSCVSYLQVRVRGRGTGKPDDGSTVNWSEAERMSNQHVGLPGRAAHAVPVVLEGA